MSELTRYNAVPKIIGQDMNVEYEACDEGQWVQADGAVTRVRELGTALRRVRFGVMLMVPEPQKSGFIEIIDAALKGK